MHRLVLRAAAVPCAVVRRRACVAASASRFAVRSYADKRRPLRPETSSTAREDTSALRSNPHTQTSTQGVDAAEVSQNADSDARIYDKDGNAIDLDSLPDGWKRAINTEDISHLSPDEQKRFLEWVNEHGEGAVIIPFDELPESWQQAVRTNDLSHLSAEERADFEAYQETRQNLREVSASDLPASWRQALETGDASHLSAEGRQELSTFIETTQILAEGENSVDFENLPESWQKAIETGETSHLTDEEAEELSAFLESHDVDGDAPAEDTSNLPGLPDGWQRALETGETSHLSTDEKKEFFGFLHQQAVRSADPGPIPNEVPQHELALSHLPLHIRQAHVAGDLEKLKDEERAQISSAEEQWRPDEIPAHWVKALATGDESDIKEDERLAYELASHNIAQSTTYSPNFDPDPGNIRIPGDIVRALKSGDTSGLSNRDLKRLQTAVTEIDNGGLDHAAAKALSEGFGGGNLDPTGGPFHTMGPRVGPDDIFKPWEIKYLADMKRLETIDRETREKPRWMSEPERIPKSHGIPVAVVHFRSHHLPLLELYIHFVTHAASALGISCGRAAKLPNQRSLWTVPRSPFIFKKSQQNFHRITHKRAIKLWDANSEVVSFFADYIVRHSLGGVGLRIVRWDRAPLGVGQEVFFNAMKHPRSHREQLASTSKKVIKAERMAAQRLEEMELLYAQQKKMAKLGSYPAILALRHANHQAHDKGWDRTRAEEELIK